MQELTIDMVRVGHLLAFAIGLGAALFLEVSVLRRFQKRIERSDLALLNQGHALIGAALNVLWITGSALLVLRVGVMGEPFTAKLMVKLAVVSVLTVNMILISQWVLPALNAMQGAAIADIPAHRRAGLGAIGGISAGCWTMALGLGGISAFRTVEPEPLATAFTVVILGGAFVGAVVGLRFGLSPRETSRESIPRGIKPA